MWSITWLRFLPSSMIRATAAGSPIGITGTGAFSPLITAYPLLPSAGGLAAALAAGAGARAAPEVLAPAFGREAGADAEACAGWVEAPTCVDSFRAAHPASTTRATGPARRRERGSFIAGSLG